MKLAHSYSSIKLFENCPQQYYRVRVKKDVKDEGSEASMMGQRLHEMLERRLKEISPLPAEAAKYENLCQAVLQLAEGAELYVEHELTLNEDLNPTTWFAGDAWLRSKLDVFIIRNNVAVYMDWKTGKRKTDTFQLDLTVAQIFKHYPEVSTVATSLVWLKDLTQDKYTYTRDMAPNLWGDIMGRIRRIYDAAESGVWPARPSGLCRYCPARHDCDSAKL